MDIHDDTKQSMCGLISPSGGWCELIYGHAQPHVFVSGEKRLERELAAVLNRYSQENASSTPDFILAQFLLNCLTAWNIGVQQRETWYGRDARPRDGMLSNLSGVGTTKG